MKWIMHRPEKVDKPVLNSAGVSLTADSVGSPSRSNVAETSEKES